MSGSRKPKKILITNIVTLNPGDAAILHGMLHILRKKYGDDAEIIVFDRLSDVASKYYPWASFRQSFFGNEPKGYLSKKLKKLGYGHWIRRFRYWKLRLAGIFHLFNIRILSKLLVNKRDFESLRIYLDSDLVVSTGGTYLIENYNLMPSIYDYKLTQALGIPLVFFTQSLGPFHKEKNKFSLKEIFNRSDCIFVRDERSKSNLLEIGVNAGKINLAKDAAFTINSESIEDKQTSGSDSTLHIAVSVRSLRFFGGESGRIYENYKNCIRAMVISAVREFDAKVTFLSTCQGIPEYWTNDGGLAEEVFLSLPADIKSNVVVDTNFRQPLEIVSAYGRFDLVIATRMHSAILSMVAGTPVLGVAYEFKLEELFDQLSMDQALISIEHMTEESSIGALRSMVEGLGEWKSLVLKNRSICQAGANSVIAKLPDL